MNNIKSEMSSSLIYLNLVKAKVLCGMSIVLKQSKWLTDKEHIYKIQANIVENIPIFLCHPDIADRIKKLCKMENIEVIDYNNYLQETKKDIT